MDKPNNEEVSDLQFPVVGIGASAGGLEAVRSFLKALPAKSGMAFVFVQHLSPTHESVLPELLQKVAPFPVELISDNVQLLPDHLYIIPQNKILTATDGVLKLAPLDETHQKGRTVDLFFSSLAHVHQSWAVGIVLSGALNDGTKGLLSIKSCGGLTFAQDDSAAFGGMPSSAVNSGSVDFILSPEKIAEQLVAINFPFIAVDDKAGQPDIFPSENEDVFKQILAVLRVRRGVDFTYYKQNTVKRRIMRRMALSKIKKLAEYLVTLRDSKNEQDALYNDMLISVTSFFREAKSIELGCRTILKKSADNSLRIWIAGCATGEEAYSFAICLLEELGDQAAEMNIQLFATDISEIAISKARRGVYSPADLEGVSPARLEQFFTKLDGHYQVNKNIRDLCVFAHHNFLKDPPFSKIDLVSCRNVLIYLEPVLQKRALSTFHYSINESGYLILGKSETVGVTTELFSNFNPQEKVYRKIGPTGRFTIVSGPGREQNLGDSGNDIQKETSEKDVYKLADEAMLIHFMPPAALVNERFDIIQFRGATDTWLVPPSGKPSHNLLKMAREGLGFELRNLLHVARQTQLPARKFAVFFKINDLQHFVNLQAVPLKDTAEPYYLVVFQNASSAGIQKTLKESIQSPENVNYDQSELRIEQLEKEISETRADMRAITDEQETANEELQSANEQLLSGSEELQTMNEELQTSKEELQSTNEEIIIVNKELIDRNEQLNTARLYTEGIVNTIREPLLILDADLRVKRATGGFYERFKTNESDTEEKFIYDLGNRQWNIPGFRELLENVLIKKNEIRDFEVTQSFPFVGKRTLCLNARQIDNIIGEKLILLAIEDVTDKRRVEQGLAEVERLLNESKERLKFAVDTAGLGTWDYDPGANMLIWDHRCREIFGMMPAGIIDLESFLKLVLPDDKGATEQTLNWALSGKISGEFDMEYRTVPIGNKTKWLKVKGKVYFDENGSATRLIGTMMDITVQKLIDEANIDLLKKKDEFISIASHELRTPITSLKALLQMAERMSAGKEELKPAHSYLQRAVKQVDKLVILIKDLLDVTKIQSGNLELRKTNFPLSDLITECCAELQDSNKTHRLICNEIENLEVYADRTRIEQVIVNLVSNAVKYSPDREKVLIDVTETDQGTKIAVTDFGIGIAKDKLPFIFDRFYRVEDNSQKYAGLGLGLYISAEIVKQHNGQIHIDSEEGKGSTFWFTIPVHKD